MAAIDNVLSRLDGHQLRKRGKDQWSCRCPAHEDRGPSLSVRELDDGRVLVHCFAGCPVENVIGALGLDVADLYPPRQDAGTGHAQPVRRRLLTAGQALDLLEQEATITFVCASDMAQGKALDEQTRERLLQAAARISMLRDEVSA